MNKIYNKTISVNIMVYNEERCIERCINSIINLADEIIIVDTGSTDNTINILKSFQSKKIKAYFQKWNNNFSEIRNIMIALSTKDVIFQIDADEYLENNINLKKIKKIINSLDEQSSFSPYIIDFYGSGYFSNLNRIFPNNGDFYFFGIIHEELRYKFGNFNQKKVDIKLLHDGYIKEVIDTKKKGRRNINLSKKMKTLEIFNPRWYYYYIKDLFNYSKNFSKILNEINSFLKLEYSLYKNEDILYIYQKEVKIIREFINIQLGNGKRKNILNLKKEYGNSVDILFLELLLLKIKFQKLKEENYKFSKEFIHIENYQDSIFNDTGDHVLYCLCQFFEMFKDLELFKTSFIGLNKNLRKEYYKKYIKDIEILYQNLKQFI